MVKTPILFEAYVRIDNARQVWEVFKEIKPEKFYFYSNKPSQNRPDQIKNNDEIRSWIKEIDWSCELHTFFRDEYVDQYTSLKSSKDWFFKNEEYGIIFEDDCVASLALFDFHEKMLKKFKDEKRIWFIGSTNYYESYNPNNFDFLFTRTLGNTYGWATWRDRWQKIDWEPDINNMISKGLFDTYYFNNKRFTYFYKRRYKSVEDFLKRTYCWDYLMDLTLIKNDGLLVIPAKNLLTNIGKVGEHYTDGDDLVINRDRYEGEKYEITNEPTYVHEDIQYDTFVYNKQFSYIDYLWSLLKSFIKDNLIKKV